ncbi:IS110 family transposase [Ignatzschineria cameli]|uniref:IS110 family transposase n=1 Tax=Ignatzschineria cameli TaxID=2182793 RepID=A0A2U2AIG9_9GAMM|nr:IS110 family transposase [Ignatzschineria cameli]
MMNDNCLSTLFVGIDVSSKSNVLCAIDFNSNKLLNLDVPNNDPGCEIIINELISVLVIHNLSHLVIAIESTSFYSTHIANLLSSNTSLLNFNVLVFCLNPKTVKAYRNSFVDLDKNDFLDAFVIADFARCGRISSSPWRGSQFLALQRLTRHRLHLVECLTREKNYILSNIYLKFSELTRLDDDRPFSNIFSNTCSSILTDFFSLDDIAYASLDSLVDFIKDKGKNRFDNPLETAKLLQKAARDSYRLDKVLYEPINVSIASSFNVIKSLEKEIKEVDKAISKNILGLYSSQYSSLISIPGIGPVLASGILAEIGTISNFSNNDKLAKYAGLTWRETQSGNFSSDNTRMTKTGNKYLRYYLIEAASSVIRYIPEYHEFYLKKYSEVNNHKHKRALVLTSRKLVRLIFGLLNKNQIYSNYYIGEIK